MKNTNQQIKHHLNNDQHTYLDRLSVTSLINNNLMSFFQDYRRRALKLDKNSAEIWTDMQTVALAGGKRLRPYLLLLAYQAYNGSSVNDILPISLAYEILHISLLIHDDIIDRDTYRHGQLNLTGIKQQVYDHLRPDVNNLHSANSAALLGGDLLFSAANSIVLESNLNTDSKLLVLRELNEALFTVGIGELMDMEASILPFSDTSTLDIINLKTAYYSFVSPLKCGGLLAGADSLEIQKLVEIAFLIGKAFQLVDDYLGVYGDVSITGKSNSSDIRERKHTYLIEQAIINATKSQKQQINKILGNPSIDEPMINSARAIIDETGAKEDLITLVKHLVDEILIKLSILKIDLTAKQQFKDVIISSTIDLI